MSFSKYLPEWLGTSHFSIDGQEIKPIDVNPYLGRFQCKDQSWQCGDTVSLKISDGNNLLTNKSMVTSHNEDGHFEIVFLRIIRALSKSENMRAVPCTDLPHPPQGWCQHPLYFNLRLFFRVEEFLESAIKVSFEENTSLFYDLKMPVNLTFPGVGNLLVPVKITAIDFEEGRGKNTAILHIGENTQFIEHTCRYMAYHCPETLTELKALGYTLQSFDFTALFSLVSYEDELMEVANLRLEAHTKKATSQVSQQKAEDFLDEFDQSALILRVHASHLLLGSCRLVFNDGQRNRSEIHRYTEIPDWLWEKGFVELSRFVTRPAFQGLDVFSLLTMHGFRTCAQLGIRYVVSDCEEHLLEPYKKRGAIELGVTFQHPLEDLKLHVIYYDVEQIISSGAPWVKAMQDFIQKREYEIKNRI